MVKITKTLRKKLREEWLKALESGKYRQTKAVLVHDRDGHKSYCCLGVACKVYKDVVDPDFKMPYPDSSVSLDEVEVVREAFGFDGGSAALTEKVNGYEFLTACNDGLTEDESSDGKAYPRLTFKQIAKLVRENPKAVWAEYSEEKNKQ
jgi:hypothetical protein